MEDRKPLNGREMQAIEYLAALDSQMVKHSETMRQRLKQVPNGWRQWRLLTAIAGKLLEQLYDTLPMKNLKHMQNICSYGEMFIRMRPISRVPEYTLVSEDDIRQLVNAAMAAECAICLRDAKEVARCPLRKCLMNIVPPEDVPAVGCGYRNVTLESDYGNYL